MDTGNTWYHEQYDRQQALISTNQISSVLIWTLVTSDTIGSTTDNKHLYLPTRYLTPNLDTGNIWHEAVSQIPRTYIHQPTFGTFTTHGSNLHEHLL